MRLAAAALFVSLALAGCGGGSSSSDEPAGATDASGCRPTAAPTARPEGKLKAPTTVLSLAKTYLLVFQTNCGSFTVTLDQKQSPKTAASLVALAKKGFFDDLTFHRIVPGFVIQGGDPTASGGGGPGYSTVDKPPANARYTKGVVAMAKTGAEAPGTSGSQFFVVTGEEVGLPPDYAIIGKVTQGLDVVERIGAQGAPDEEPLQPIVIEKVTVEES